VIAGLFTSGVVFTAILFYFVYNERISNKILAGMALVICGVLCVSVKDDSNELVDYNMLWISVFFAMLTGMAFATNAFIVKHYCKNVGFSPFQLTLDGNAVSAVPMIIGYILVQMSDTPISIIDSAIGVTISFLYVCGSICFAHALTSGGLGGPIQAIDSLKSLIPLFLHGLIGGVMPTVSQWIGVILGISGAFVIGM
jgi:drug/metabolite transporter (DMT)-like permease